MTGFGNIAVARRADWFLSRIGETKSLVLTRIGGERSGEIAAHRLLSSPHVSVEAVIDLVSRRTASQCVGRDIVVAQDTSEVNFKGRAAAREGFGPGGDGVSPGFFLHPQLAIDAAGGSVVGLVGARIWTRGQDPAPEGRRAPGDKESARWLEGAERAGRVLSGAARITVVGDRESDVYHLFAHRPPMVDLIVRAAQNRVLEDGERLFAALCAAPVSERRAVILTPRRPGEARRTAQVEIRARRVDVARPGTLRAGEAPASVAMTLVDARETNAPAGVKPVLWRLLASADRPAGEIVDLYRQRWRIEEVFRVLKSGLGLPDTQIHHADRVMILSAFAIAGAARIVALVDARDGSERPLEDMIDPAFKPALLAISRKLEGKTDRQKNPHSPDSLAFLSWVCARLGGWNCYYKPPGPKIIHIGWNVLVQRIEGYALATET